MNDARRSARLTLGRIAGLFGVKGWVKVHSYTRPPADILNYRDWLVGDGEDVRHIRLAEGRVHGAGVVARLDGYEDRDRARALIGCSVGVDREVLPALPSGEYYWCDLEGLAVVNGDGVALGRVDHLIETGANDVLVIKGERERLVPYTPQVVRRVDLEAGVMEVDWDADD